MGDNFPGKLIRITKHAFDRMRERIPQLESRDNRSLTPVFIAMIKGGTPWGAAYGNDKLIRATHHGSDTEVVFVVRKPTDPTRTNEVYVATVLTVDQAMANIQSCGLRKAIKL